MIDNETLRDQVQHLQKKIAALEDSLEDAQAVAEREESTARERITRLREKDEAMKKELNEARKDVERMVKSEAGARSRVEEIEEALRESTSALENSRAEIESLRNDLAVSLLSICFFHTSLLFVIEFGRPEHQAQLFYLSKHVCWVCPNSGG